MLKSKNSKVLYRPEIDGLRAIAVISVIFYHAQITFFSQKIFVGGFIGVDIFFVISGYLITSIILKELVIKGTFSFKNFYERRARRILPVLLFVILASLPFAWNYLLPSIFIDFSKTILFSLGFSSNFYFNYSASDYFGSHPYKPFLHTWSLSIEEQFYIIFPLILIITFKYFKKYLFVFLLIGFFTSLLISDWASIKYSSKAFYLIVTRAWELIAGSILAYLQIIKGYRAKNRSLNSSMPSIGIFLIFLSIFFFKDEVPHPSFYTLLPIFGVCLVIWFSNKDELITKILSSKFFVGIGLISYSLYLWHYPIFVFNDIIKTEYNLFILIIIITLLSIFSYFYIELPARNKNNKFRPIFLLIFSTFIFLLYFNFNVLLKNGYEKRFYYSATYKLSNLEHDKSISNFMKNYNYENYDERKNVLVVGNCFGWDIFRILSNTNLSKQYYFSSALLENKNHAFEVKYLYNFLTNKKTNMWQKFNKITDKQYKSAEYIILASEYTNADLEILDELIEILKSDNKKVLIFTQVAHQHTFNNLSLLDTFVYKNKIFPNDESLKKIERQLYTSYEDANNFDLKIKDRSILFDRRNIFCDRVKKSCHAVTDENYKIYWDVGHITDKAAKFFAKKIETNKIFLKFLDK
jgi:peptidoglycan/LPS O-acetylase OafA/YrhL